MDEEKRDLEILAAEEKDTENEERSECEDCD